MKVLNKSISALAVAVLLMSCGRGGSSKQTFSQIDGEPVTTDKILGTWNSGCLPVEAGISYRPGSRLFRLHFDFSGVATLREYTYVDASCTTRIFEQISDGRFRVESGGRKFTLNFTSFIVTPLSTQGAAIMNQARFCGTNTWAAGASRDVRNAPCTNNVDSTNDVAKNETQRLVTGLCASRATSALDCEVITFGYEGTSRGQSSGLDFFEE